MPDSVADTWGKDGVFITTSGPLAIIWKNKVGLFILHTKVNWRLVKDFTANTK